MWLDEQDGLLWRRLRLILLFLAAIRGSDGAVFDLRRAFWTT